MAEMVDVQTVGEQLAERVAEYHRGWRVGHEEGLLDAWHPCWQGRKPGATVPEFCDDDLGENEVGSAMGYTHGYAKGLADGAEIERHTGSRPDWIELFDAEFQSVLRARLHIDENGDVICEDATTLYGGAVGESPADRRRLAEAIRTARRARGQKGSGL